ncbi:MAG: Mu transposase C-terminal domain-containing protein, partial [Lachnospiraceae bacterium]|nr:Mu transposase C-terminal domain-containing protein [Lachnospiraceae bacterium]
EFAPNVGVGMFDSTICDIYLVSESGELVGRPILTACVDANSSLLCGYSLSWEGGNYSLRGLMLNIVCNKVEHCRKFGIPINKSDWNCSGKVPGVFVTDKGAEYASENFEQIAELGVSIINLPAYRPELKGIIEKFFDLVQDSFKPYLKGKGIIMPDFQERGSHDYRKDACLTLNQFEKILLHCIIYYNTQRIIKSYPYTEDMIQMGIKPYASAIWNYGLKQPGCNLISVSDETLILCLLPRTQAKFSRSGLKVNGLRYKCDGFTEDYLSGSAAIAAYNPDDVSCVWLIRNNSYIRFMLVQSRYDGMELEDVKNIERDKKELVKAAETANLQAKVNLAKHIEAIVSTAARSTNADIKNVRKAREREKSREHVDFVKERGMHD